MPTDGAATGVSLTGFHAISTMLNHPQRRAPPIDAGAARFPPVGRTSLDASEIPAADQARIDAYIAEIGPLWERYERERAPHRAVVPPRLPPLSAVPQAFFSADFDLGRPSTFDAVTERHKRHAAAGLDDHASPYDVVLNQMLQEKLSYYSDVIEQHLVAEIGAKSPSFFDALDTLQRLGGETGECIARIDTLYTQLDHVDTHVVHTGLEIVREQHARRELEAQQALLGQVRALVEQRDLATLLVDHGELDDAVAVTAHIHTLLDGELGVLTALQPLRPEVDALREKIALQLADECAALLDARQESVDVWLRLRTGGPHRGERERQRQCARPHKSIQSLADSATFFFHVR